MLKKILSISGKPGLFKLISQGKSALIVESLMDGKKIPAHARDKVISLNDIAIYTDEEEKPLREVLQAILEKESGKSIAIDFKKDTAAMKTYFETVLPAYDRDRVYPADIKKVLTWYNILVENGITQFSSEEVETTPAE
ncbi:MAG: DUF5606 domain-containing protein [Bacteroidales bacterium]|nr:DUF5606 domain-containing protein [Bacteroidales bacterium]